MDKKKLKKRLNKFFNEDLKRMGISMEYVALTIGCNYWTLYSWKNGTRTPRLSTVLLLQKEFKVKLIEECKVKSI